MACPAQGADASPRAVLLTRMGTPLLQRSFLRKAPPMLLDDIVNLATDNQLFHFGTSLLPCGISLSCNSRNYL